MMQTLIQNRNGLTHIENTFVIAEEDREEGIEFHVGVAYAIIYGLGKQQGPTL